MGHSCKQTTQDYTEAALTFPNREASKTKRFYLPELDGLRFYAFLGVYVYHTLPSQPAFYKSLHLPFPVLWGAVIKSGAAGVDLFFALSAFLITSLLLEEREQRGRIKLRLFYLRRALRIWPLYFAVICLGVLVAHTLPGQQLAWYHVVGYALFIGNWVSAVFGNPHSICAPLWTVSIEEQFYLVWPWLMAVLSRRGLILAAAAMVVLAMASQAGVVLAGWSGGLIYYGTFSRCAPLGVGALLALYARRLPRLRNAQRAMLFAGALTLCISSAAWLVDQPGPLDMRMVAGRLLVSLGAGAMLLSCLHTRHWLFRARLTVRLGKISYGLYVLHLLGVTITFMFLRPVAGWQTLLTKGVALLTTTALALASYRWIESPFLRWKDQFATILSRPV